MTKALAEHALGRFHHLVLIAAQLDAAGLSAPASVDLRLDDPELATDFAGTVSRLLGAVGYCALGGAHTKTGQDFLGLVLMKSMAASPHAALSSARLGLTPYQS